MLVNYTDDVTVSNNPKTVCDIEPEADFTLLSGVSTSLPFT